ncbi:TetR family transcriptional regulator [Mycobacteroides salmoniphilum]|uniref:TetR family transcriptional regulator n=1 Tax=Mycobacteroides salmoniphilum TaxID=404941 RepID=UPI000BFF6B63|nr:TetR family transcriptional regulator [Mycobacteroides salmoniphilum]
MDMLMAPDPEIEQAIHARIRDAAVEQFGRKGFDVDLAAIAHAAGAGVDLAAQLVGSTGDLRRECDAYVAELVKESKSEALQSISPDDWFRQLAEVDSYAPIMKYLVRSMISGGDLGRALMHQMIDNAEAYLEDAVTMGSIVPSRDPKARARFLALNGGGGFLLYLHMHETPDDMRAVLRDYDRDMIMPALELYTNGLLAGSAMYEAFLNRSETQPRAVI